MSRTYKPSDNHRKKPENAQATKFPYSICFFLFKQAAPPLPSSVFDRLATLSYSLPVSENIKNIMHLENEKYARNIHAHFYHTPKHLFRVKKGKLISYNVTIYKNVLDENKFKRYAREYSCTLIAFTRKNRYDIYK